MPALPPHPPSPRAQRLAALARPRPPSAPPADPDPESGAGAAVDNVAPPGEPRRLRDGPRTALIFGIAFLVACALYWPAMARKTNLPEALYGGSLLLPPLVTLADAWFSGRPFRRALWIGASVLPAAVFARVVYDGLRDPTSHNLWPFEIAIAYGVGIPAALAGAVLAALLLRLRGRRG